VVQALPAEVVLDLSGDKVAVPYDQIDSATQALPW
jgi:hypothetical protein